MHTFTVDESGNPNTIEMNSESPVKRPIDRSRRSNASQTSFEDKTTIHETGSVQKTGTTSPVLIDPFKETGSFPPIPKYA